MNRIGERIARTIGVLALLAALVRSVWPPAAAARADAGALSIDRRNADSAVAVARAVAARVIDHAAEAASVAWPVLSARFSVVPSVGVRAVLGAAAHAGMQVRWRDASGVRALALDASGAPMPQSSTLIGAVVSMTGGAAMPALVVRDEGGVLDSVAGTAGPLRLRATRLRGPVRALVQRDGQVVASATVAVPAPATVRRVLLMGQPGWETKFVGAALEESGWLVDGTLALSPRARIRIGVPSSPDTARYSAVVVLDSGLANARELRRFLEQGGGVVIAGDALRDRALAPFAPARIDDDRAVVAGALLTDQPRRGLPAFHLVTSRPALVLEREGSALVVVVARRGVGRVLASGYRGTWHWRMEGRDESADAHRRWWNELVSAVAFAPVATDTAGAGPAAIWPGDAAPVADLVARLGGSSTDTAVRIALTSRATMPSWLLFAIACAALLVEWALRRLRGAP